jgi:uncharacterized protein (TIGR02646 family)
MIYVARLPSPDILVKKAADWKTQFLTERIANPTKDRPDHSKYAHPEIKDYLARMSFHKCFYCERRLKEKEFVIDHYIEVVERPDLAFEWENLYLCCKDCNGKLRNTTLPNVSTLNPCARIPDHKDHLAFEDEQIRAHNNSALGQQTIKKYKLDREDLDFRRQTALREFDKRLIIMQKHVNHEGRNTMTEEEKEILRSFKQAERPFSLMFTYYLNQQHL